MDREGTIEEGGHLKNAFLRIRSYVRNIGTRHQMEQIQNEVTRFAEDIVCFTTIGFEPGIVWAAEEKCNEPFAFGMVILHCHKIRFPKSCSGMLTSNGISSSKGDIKQKTKGSKKVIFSHSNDTFLLHP